MYAVPDGGWQFEVMFTFLHGCDVGEPGHVTAQPAPPLQFSRASLPWFLSRPQAGLMQCHVGYTAQNSVKHCGLDTVVLTKAVQEIDFWINQWREIGAGLSV